MNENKASIYFEFINTGELDSRLVTGQFPFSKYLFWDSDIQNLDLKKNHRFIIERALTRGFLEDFYLIIKIYSSEEIKDALGQSKILDPKTAHFCAHYFDIPISKLHVSPFYS